MTSPGTSSRAAGVIHFPSRLTRALIASLAFSAAMALPAWCSSQNPTTALASSSTRMMTEVRPMLGDRREDHGRFDHPRDGAPEIGEEFQQRIGLLFFNLVRPILGQPLLRLGLTEAVRRRPQVVSPAFRHGQGSSDRPSHRRRLRCRRLSICRHESFLISLTRVWRAALCAFTLASSSLLHFQFRESPACPGRACRCTACARSACP